MLKAGWLRRHLRIVVLVVFILAILPSYLWPYSLTGASAAPTILLGDTFVENWAAYDFRVPYSRIVIFHVGSPRRGDIVQAYLPSTSASASRGFLVCRARPSKSRRIASSSTAIRFPAIRSIAPISPGCRRRTAWEIPW